MKPILWQIGPLKIHAFGLFLALGFLIAGIVVMRRGRARGMSDDAMTGWITWVLVASLAGARIYYALAHPDRFAGRWGDIFAIWQGGLVLHGGILAAVAASAIYVRKAGWSFADLVDVVAPGLAFGVASGRLGCFFNGCCFGVPAGDGWGLVFPEGCSAASAFPGVPLHPTQLYMAALEAALGAVLLWLDRPASSFRRRFPSRGALFGLYLLGSSAARLGIDRIRHYEAGDIWWGGLAHSQIVSLLFAAAGVYLLARRERRKKGSR
jgi:phosphatidylglycerol:prolipoprotein diacylglycerol transferase